MKLFNENFIESRFTSEGEVNINGNAIPYKVISEDNMINDDGGKPMGSIFSFSYFRSDIENRRRPVVFVYNGGPGSSSLFLHLGFFGPKRVKLDDVVHPPVCPPFEAENNPHCLLDICDIVMIDPVGTGYGRLLDEQAAPQFFSVQQDAYYIGLFIEGWLNKYNRWDSPRFLVGESYGTIRNCALLDILMGGYSNLAGNLNGISVNGVIMLGPGVTTTSHYEQEGVEASVINLPTMAAVSWYHKREGKPKLEVFVEEAYRFSYDVYLRALFLGDRMPKDQFDDVVCSLSYYTGIDKHYFTEKGLRIDIEDFAGMLLKKEEMRVGFYDGRYILKNSNIGITDHVGDDPALCQCAPIFIGVMNNIVKKQLNITFERAYKSLVFDISKGWKFNYDRKPLQSLLAAMRRNRDMRVFFGSGHYDLCAVTGLARYTASHMGMTSERVIVKEYPSGHMPYLGEESVKMLADDMREFLSYNL